MDKGIKTGWVESHKILGLMVYAGILFLAAQIINFIFFASYREAVTQVIKAIRL